MSEAPPVACAGHPAQLALAQCARCGRAACPYCLPDAGDVCVECLARAEPPGVIAWERADLGVLTRFWRTTRDVLTRPHATLTPLAAPLGSGALVAPHAGGSLGAALRYAALLQSLLAVAALLLLTPFVLLAALGWQTPLLGPTSPYVLVAFVVLACTAPFVAALVGVVDALLVGALFHFAARALGGTGSYALSTRAAAYALAVQAVWLVLAPGAALPVVGPIVLGVACVAQLLWLGGALTDVARERHALSSARARVAGFAPSLLIAVLVVVVLVAVSLASDALHPSQGPDVYR